MVRTMNLMFMRPLLYCLCYRVCYFLQGNFISHATSMDQEYSRPLDGVEGQRRQFHIHNMYLFQKRQSSALCSVEEDLSNPLSTSWLSCLPPKNCGLLANSSDIARSLCWGELIFSGPSTASIIAIMVICLWGHYRNTEMAEERRKVMSMAHVILSTWLLRVFTVMDAIRGAFNLPVLWTPCKNLRPSLSLFIQSEYPSILLIALLLRRISFITVLASTSISYQSFSKLGLNYFLFMNLF